MPIVAKEKLNELNQELRIRFSTLSQALSPRELKSSNEGAGRGQWSHPERLAATEANTMQLHLAVEDFKNILAEIKKLK